MSKTKIYSALPAGTFTTKGYNTFFRLDRNQNNRGLLPYVRKDFPCKILNEYAFEKPFKEINL